MGILNFLKKKESKITVTFLAALVLMVLLSTIALAGYSYKEKLNSYRATAVEDFYFTSNLLTADETPPVYQITHDWGAGAPAAIGFELRNYEDLFHISKREIAYTIEAELEDPAAPLELPATISGTISVGGAGGNSKDINVHVTPDPEELLAEPVAVMVTATATSPYAKTLRGKFIISPAISYRVEANAGSPVAILTVALAQSAELTREVKITWPEGAVPDMTNPLVIAAVDGEAYDLTGRTLTTTVKTAATYELVFFKDQETLETEYTGITLQGVQ
jgi:hypothetical protein